MKIIGKFKCPRCGPVHNGISEADAAEAVLDTNAYLATLTKEEQEQWYGGKTISINRYMQCFYCGCPSNDFLPVNRGD